MNKTTRKTNSLLGAALGRLRGFTLVEVVVGSVVLAAFMGGAIYMSGEVAQARIRSLQTRDVNAWANVQAQMAAEGIDATKTNGNLWNNKAFASLTGGSFDADTSSAPLANAELRSVRIHPFLVDFSKINTRDNNFSLGFRILDTETATGAPGELKKDQESASGTFAVAVYNHSTGTFTPANVTDGGTFTFDAWDSFEWGAGGPNIYIIAKPTGEVSGITLSQNSGGAAAMTNSKMPGSSATTDPYTYYTLLNSSTFLSSGGVAYANLDYSVTSSGETTSGSFRIEVKPMTPTVVTQMLNYDYSDRQTSKNLSVRLQDAMPSVGVLGVTEGQRLLMNSGRLAVSVYGTTDTTTDSNLVTAAALKDLVNVTTYLNSVAINAPLNESISKYCADVPAGLFKNVNVPLPLSVFVNPASDSTVANLFISPASSETGTSIRPIGTNLPRITISPSEKPGPMRILASLEVTLGPVAEYTEGKLDEGGFLNFGWNTSIYSFYLYDIQYIYLSSGVEIEKSFYSKFTPLIIGREMTYETNAEVDAKALCRYNDLAAFLVEQPQDSALYVKSLGGDNAYVWNYSGPYSKDKSKFTSRIYWDNVDSGINPPLYSWSKTTSAGKRNAPGDGVDDAGLEQNALFQSAIPFNDGSVSSSRPNHTVWVDRELTISGLFFDYAPAGSDPATSGFTLLNYPESNSNRIIFNTPGGSQSEMSTLTNDAGKPHVLSTHIRIDQPLVVNTQNSASNITISDVYNQATASTTSSDGVIKQGDGTLALNIPQNTVNSGSGGPLTSGSNYTTSNIAAHKVRYVVEGGTLKLAQNNAVTKQSDDANQAGVILNGGTWDMAGFDQDFDDDDGILTVTAASGLKFGANGYYAKSPTTPSLLWVGNVEIPSGKLTINNYAFPRENVTDITKSSYDTFYSKYPGLESLSRVVFADLTKYWEPSNTRLVTGRWRPLSNSSSVNGEIIPRRPPQSTGIAYLTVSANSRIFFESAAGTGVKLSVEDISIFNGAILEIRNWTVGKDMLFVAPSKTTVTISSYDVYQACKYYTTPASGSAKSTGGSASTNIRFYDDAGKFIGYGNLIGPINVSRTDLNDSTKVVTGFTVYKVEPKL
jgi:hypothetical protein